MGDVLEIKARIDFKLFAAQASLIRQGDHPNYELTTLQEHGESLIRSTQRQMLRLIIQTRRQFKKKTHDNNDAKMKEREKGVEKQDGKSNEETKESQRCSEKETVERNDTNSDCDQDGDASLINDTDYEEIDTAEKKKNRSTAAAVDQMRIAKIPCWIDTGKQRNGTLIPAKKKTKLAQPWEDRKRWEYEINEFLRSERIDEETNDVERNNDAWIKTTKDQKRWKKMKRSFETLTAAAHVRGASAEGERTTAYEICYFFGFELRRLLSADLREWQAFCAWKISGPIDETKPLVDEEFATFFHVLPNFYICSSHFQSSCFVCILLVFARGWFAASFVCGALSVISVCSVVYFSFIVTLPQLASGKNLFQRIHSQTFLAITSWDPVSDSTTTAVVTEIDEDSAFTEGQDNLRVLLSKRKRHSVEMNASTSVGEEGDPRCAGTDVDGMRMEDDIGDFDERHRSGQKKQGKKCCEGCARPIEAWCVGARSTRGGAHGGTRCDCCRDRQGCSHGDETGKSDENFFRVGGHQNEISLRFCGWENGNPWTEGAGALENFEVKWSEKVVHLDDKEVVICSAEFRIRRAVQQDEDERWKKRMANEDEITTKAIETLGSDRRKWAQKILMRLFLWKTATKEVQLARSLVLQGVVAAGTTWRPEQSNSLWWQPESNSKDGAVGETFVELASQWTRLNSLWERQRRVWSKMTWTCSTGNWRPGIFDTKMMVFLWFKEDVTPVMRKEEGSEWHPARPYQWSGPIHRSVRATLELDPLKGPWNKAQAIFFGVMTQYANLPREAFDIRWVVIGLRVSVAIVHYRRKLDKHNLKSFVSSHRKWTSKFIRLLLDAWRRSSPWLLCTITLNREKGVWCCEWFVDLRHKHHILYELPCFYALQETDHWTTSAMNVRGYIVYGTDHGRTAILSPR